VLILFDPDLRKDHYMNKIQFVKGHPLLLKWVDKISMYKGVAFFSSDAEAHTRGRKFLNQAFTFDQLKTFVPIFSQVA
jgi:cytochrome P450